MGRTRCAHDVEPNAQDRDGRQMCRKSPFPGRSKAMDRRRGGRISRESKTGKTLPQTGPSGERRCATWSPRQRTPEPNKSVTSAPQRRRPRATAETNREGEAVTHDRTAGRTATAQKWCRKQRKSVPRSGAGTAHSRQGTVEASLPTSGTNTRMREERKREAIRGYTTVGNRPGFARARSRVT